MNKHQWTTETPTAEGLYLQYRDDKFNFVLVRKCRNKPTYHPVGDDSTFNPRLLAGEWVLVQAKQEPPELPIQLTHCYVALNVLGAYLDTVEPSVQDKGTLTQLAKIRRWHAECVKDIPQAPKHSACWRIGDKKYAAMHEKLHSKVVGLEMNNEPLMAAWCECVYGVFLDALSLAKNYINTRAWKYLDQTFTKLAKSFEQQFPDGSAIGRDVFLTLE